MTRKQIMRRELTGVAVASVLVLTVVGWLTAAAQQPATSQAAPEQPTQETILEELLKERPTNAPISPMVPGQADQPAEVAATQPAHPEMSAGRLLPDGFIISKRTGRLVRQGPWWVFAFESDGKAMQDPPMRLLPCRWLEHMEAASGGGTRGVRFVVTGRVTAYRGLNYLLCENVLIVHDMGNFK